MYMCTYIYMDTHVYTYMHNTYIHACIHTKRHTDRQTGNIHTYYGPISALIKNTCPLRFTGGNRQQLMCIAFLPAR